MSTTQPTIDLTIDNAKVGLTIINKSNPQWGEATLQHDGHFWIFKNRAGSAVLHTGEFRFWAIVIK